jgi:enolase
MKTSLCAVHAWEALDSRGRPTVGCRVTLEGGGTGRVIVPSGASTGAHEAKELRDGEVRYQGYGVRRAVEAVNTVLGPALLGRVSQDQVDIDSLLVELDGASDLGTLGANAVLATSLATLLATADQQRQPLWRTLSDGRPPLLPMPMVNIISGGAHAGGAIDLQDILVVPVGAGSFREAMEWVSRIRAACAEILEGRGVWTALVADEGGLSGRLPNNETAIAAVTEAIERAGLVPVDQVGLAVDVAANQIVSHGIVTLAVERVALDTSAWLERLAQWSSKYPILSWEDVLPEDDWDGWKSATHRLQGMQLVGDDLFATNLDRLNKGIGSGIANAVLIKPNQAGTVTRARDVAAAAQANGYSTIISARSGDTEDCWLADLAVGWRTGQIKVGSTMRSERTAKWNRLLEIESMGGSTFADPRQVASELLTEACPIDHRPMSGANLPTSGRRTVGARS